jgi:arabinogalactan oligomer/maltooligosaccharide transport system permease protein
LHGRSRSLLIPAKGLTLEHYAAMLSGERASFLRRYLDTVIVCGVVAVVQVFLSLLAAYAFSRSRFSGRRGGMLAVLLVMMFPAIIDGATHWQTSSRILVPSMTPILATTLLLALVASMSEFLIGSIFLTDDSEKTLAVGMYGMFSSDPSNNLGVFAAGSVMVMLPVIVLYQVLQKYIAGGSTAGAVKG